VTARRTALLAAILILAAIGAYVFVSRQGRPGQSGHLTVYYTKLDGTTLGTWTVTVRPKQPGESNSAYVHDAVLYAAVQAVAGPPSEVQAVRFPPGTHVLGVIVNGSTATVDLSKEVASQTGSFTENGEFKSLVYTVTGVPPIDAVQVTIDGHIMGTLPGGHLELDTPLHRSDW
jgi:spore germination protein GerM